MIISDKGRSCTGSNPTSWPICNPVGQVCHSVFCCCLCNLAITIEQLWYITNQTQDTQVIIGLTYQYHRRLENPASFSPYQASGSCGNQRAVHLSLDQARLQGESPHGPNLSCPVPARHSGKKARTGLTHCCRCYQSACSSSLSGSSSSIGRKPARS